MMQFMWQDLWRKSLQERKVSSRFLWLFTDSKPLIESVHSCRKEDNYVVCQVRPVDGHAQDHGDAAALLGGGLQ